MKIIGLKLAKWKQWLEVLAEEGKNLTWRDWLGMAWLGLWIPFTSDRKLWRARMRACRKCPIYDQTLRRCRPFTGSPLGCGCFTPLKAMTTAQCWARENVKDSWFGWPE